MSSWTLLCIDDQSHLLEHRKAMLEANGFNVRIGTNACAAMNILEKTTVDAVLVEYKQEGIDAEAVAYYIKQRFPHLPIVLLSAYSDMPERILWLVDEYVMKSELERLIHIIRQTIVRLAGKKRVVSCQVPRNLPCAASQ